MLIKRKYFLDMIYLRNTFFVVKEMKELNVKSEAFESKFLVKRLFEIMVK